ncbi:MAG: adenylate/guanylate cyclase domain-containing protein [Fimbriimonadaceae bacterium]
MRAKGWARALRWRTFAVAAVSAAACLLTWPLERPVSPVFAPIRSLERMGLDALFALRGPDADGIHPDIVVVGFTGDSQTTLGTGWPPPRSIHAKVIDNINRDGPAAAIVMDVLFQTGTSSEEDRALDEAIRRAGNVILSNRVERGLGQSVGSRGIPPLYYDDDLGIDLLEYATEALAEVPIDEDRILRRFLPALRHQDEWVPTLATAAYLRYRALMGPNRGSDPTRIAFDGDTLVLGADRIPGFRRTGSDPFDGAPVHTAYIQFPAGFAAFPLETTFDQVALGEFPAGVFRGKIVFVGLTGLDLTKQENDQYVTSYSHFRSDASGSVQTSQVPGVVVQAHYANALLNRLIVVPAPSWLVFAGVFAMTYVGVALVRVLLNWRGPLMLAMWQIAFLGAVYLAFDQAKVHFPWVVPLAALQVSAMVLAWSDRGALRRKWGSYVSPAVLDQILKEDAPPAQRAVGSIVFGDIRGFTNFSDSHDAAQVVRLLNAHFGRMVEIVYEEQGTVDKFLGDGILVVFGAPIPQSDAALRAVRAAWRMREASRAPVEDDGEPFVMATGFGVTTGEFVSGHVGGARRHDFTVIGDIVNVAARLQGVTGEPDIVIDEATFRQVRDRFVVEPLGEVSLKGKPMPVTCYRVVGVVGEQTPAPAPGRFADPGPGPQTRSL